MKEENERCRVCQYYDSFTNKLKDEDNHFIKSLDPWEQVRDEGVHLCERHISLMILRNEWRMVNGKYVGKNGGESGSLVPTYFHPKTGRFMSPISNRLTDVHWWEKLNRLHKQRKGS